MQIDCRRTCNRESAVFVHAAEMIMKVRRKETERMVFESLDF